MCGKDITFSLTFLTKTEMKPFMFYRLCDPLDQTRYQKAAYYLFNKMHLFLTWAGFYQNLEIIRQRELAKKND